MLKEKKHLGHKNVLLEIENGQKAEKIKMQLEDNVGEATQKIEQK